MKRSVKIICLAVSVLLIASFAAVFACPAAAEESRPSCKPVSNEAEFLAMERGGEYFKLFSVQARRYLEGGRDFVEPVEGSAGGAEGRRRGRRHGSDDGGASGSGEEFPGEY